MRFLKVYYKSLVLVLLPILLLPLLTEIGTKEARCAYVVLITAVYWMFEVLPLAVTSLLPVTLFPILDVSSIEDVSTKYLRQINMLFIGSLIVAVAVEESMLHKRLALRVLMMVGTDIKWIMLGSMFITWFLSMWITNTSATAMMLPIVQAILGEIEDIEMHSKKRDGDENDGFGGDVSLDVLSGSPQNTGGHGESSTDNVAAVPIHGEKKERAEHHLSMRKGMLLCIAYGANIGGTATLTGTPPNLELVGQLNSYYGHGESGVNFASWLIFSLPNSFITLIVAWVWLCILFIGFRRLLCCRRSSSSTQEDEADKGNQIRQVIVNQFNELGPMSFCEIAVLLLFILLAVLWISRNPEFIEGAKGWGSLFTKSYVTDSTAALIVAISFFIVPREWPDWSSDEPTKKILDWHTVQHKLPWNVVLLMGAGFAIASNVQSSGLSGWVGEELKFLSDISPSLILFILCCVVAMVTELASNTAVAVIIIPILKEMSQNLLVNPLYLMVPCVISASFAFMLPVATPPNAIVFSTGDLLISDMMKCGFLMNIFSISILQFSINTYGVLHYNLDTYPRWAISNNVTTTSTP